MATLSEWDVQRAFTIWFKGEKYAKNHALAGQWKSPPHMLPGVVAWHTPNGGERRDAFEGMRLKQTGVEAGIHDYLFLWGGLFGLEFKKPGRYKSATDGLSPAQIAMHPRMIAAGMVKSAVVDNLPDAKAAVISWGLTIKG